MKIAKIMVLRTIAGIGINKSVGSSFSGEQIIVFRQPNVCEGTRNVKYWKAM